MWRIVGAVVLGYLVLAVLVMGTFSVAYLALGADGAFRPGTYEPSTVWLVTSFVLGFLAAMVGGWLAILIARRPSGPISLAAFVVVFGLLVAVPVLMAHEPGEVPVREGPVGNLEAMQKARQPGWVALANPFVGALGVLLGGRLRRSDRKAFDV